MNSFVVGTAEIIKADARDMPIEDESIDLIISSPPYFALRSYQDDGQHYAEQIGSEATPQDFLDALWAVMAECWRVLKPSGSCWINLGDKYSQPGHFNPNNGGLRCADESSAQLKASGKRVTAQWGGIPNKSLMGLPWRFAIGCIDGKAAPEGKQWILRAEVVWSKPNGLPESVTDRVRRSHEQWFHLVKSPRYFAAVDEIREPRSDKGPSPWSEKIAATGDHGMRHSNTDPSLFDPRGKLPGSVWTIPSEPLRVPEELGIDHFAAFPTEWPRKIILGWSPSGVCVDCGEGRRPVVEKDAEGRGRSTTTASDPSWVAINRADWQENVTRTITGYVCACPEPTAPTTPARILDPFGGTGTVAMVAKALGRHGISNDLSADYCRLAEWRTTDPQALRDIQARTYGIKREGPKVSEGQIDLFGE